MHMENVGAFTPNKWTIISRNFAVRTAAFKSDPTDSTKLLVFIIVNGGIGSG